MHKFKCFLINLDKDQDRLTFMNLELKRIGLEYSRQPAVYGKMLTEKEVSALYDYEYSGNNNLGNMNLGEIGCALSHRSVYEKIIREDIDYTLVLEDDVLLPDNFKEVVGEVISLNKASDSWDYLSFDYYA